MTIAFTLSAYVSRQFLAAVLAMMGALSGLVSLFDLIELLRRAATRPAVAFSLVTEIAALRVPFIALRLLPFAILLGGIVAFWRLTRSSELIVARAAGVTDHLTLPTASRTHRVGDHLTEETLPHPLHLPHSGALETSDR